MVEAEPRPLSLQQVMAEYEAARGRAVEGVRALLEHRIGQAVGLGVFRRKRREFMGGVQSVQAGIDDLLLVLPGSESIRIPDFIGLRSDGRLYGISPVAGASRDLQTGWKWRTRNGYLSSEISEERYLTEGPAFLDVLEHLIARAANSCAHT